MPVPVIEPLFLDGLRAEFRRLQARRDGRSMADLRKFRDKLGDLRLFDPACGCGNFLSIAYRELRTLEIDVLREIASRASATQLALAVRSVVDVDQFYGIEIGEFPARIAATAMWMMDHIMNNRLNLEFGQTYARIPIEKSPHIRNADALEIDWADVLPPDECSYVFGNPPFAGAKFQSPEQRAQVRRGSASWRPIRSRRASRWRNSGHCCLTIAVWRSPSLIGPAPGVRTLAAWRTCTWSSSGWTRPTTRQGIGACSPTRTSTGNRSKAATP